MPIHVYLKNGVVKAVQFRTKGQAGSSKPGGVFLTGSTMSEIDLSTNKTGRLYFEIDGGDIIPSVLEQYIDEISIWGTIPSNPHREFGIYETESARAEVEVYSLSNESIKVTSKTLAGALELVEKIKAGTIRPSKSYEAPQCGKTNRQLEDELITAKQQLGEVWEENNRLRITGSQVIAERKSAESELDKCREERTEIFQQLNGAIAEVEHLRDKLIESEKSFANYRAKFIGKQEQIDLLRLYAGELFDSPWPITLKPMVTAKIKSIIGQFTPAHPPVED